MQSLWPITVTFTSANCESERHRLDCRSLFVNQQDSAHRTHPISINLCDRMAHVPRKNSLHFGAYLDENVERQTLWVKKKKFKKKKETIPSWQNTNGGVLSPTSSDILYLTVTQPSSSTRRMAQQHCSSVAIQNLRLSNSLGVKIKRAGSLNQDWKNALQFTPDAKAQHFKCDLILNQWMLKWMCYVVDSSVPPKTFTLHLPY